MTDAVERIYAHLRQACELLDDREDHAIAAMVSQCLAMMRERYGILGNHPDGDTKE